MLTQPYVTAAEFQAHPTFLDTQSLRAGQSLATSQSAALTDVLLMASQWADDFADQPFKAASYVEQKRLMPDRRALLKWHPANAPVLSVTALSYGYLPNQLTAITDLSGVWVEQGEQIVAQVVSQGATGLGMLQFGAPAFGGEIFTRWTYLAGYPATQLAAPASIGASAITVADATGIAIGTVLRLWTPGAEEAVTVSAVAGSVLTLSSTLASAHAVGDSCSALPSTVRLAVIQYAVCSLERPAAAAESGYPTGKRSSLAVKGKSGAKVSVSTAESLLGSFVRVR